MTTLKSAIKKCCVSHFASHIDGDQLYTYYDYYWCNTHHCKCKSNGCAESDKPIPKLDLNALPDTAEEAAEKWAHPALLKIWAIVMMPDYEDGEPVLHEQEIGEIGKAVLELNRDFNKSEVKRLYRHLKEMV